MKYEVIVLLKNNPILSWRFKTINQVVKFCCEIDFDLVDVELYRLKDMKSFDAVSLVELFKGENYA